MGRRLTPIPRPLLRGPFTTERAVAAGLDKKRLRVHDVAHPFRGVHVAAGTAETTLSRCAAYLLRMPSDGFYCGPTAAIIQGVPLPIGLEQATELHVGVPRPHRAVRRAGVIGHKLDVAEHQVRMWRGLPVTEPARTWRDLAPHLSLDDLIAAGDHLLSGDLPLATRDELTTAAVAASGARGARRLVQALPLLDGRSESRRETRLRLLLIRAGIDGFEPNHWVTLARPRRRYRIDIAFPHVRVGLEYQGEYHHDLEQWRDDMTRLSRLRADGWTMVEISSQDLHDPAELAHRIRRIVEGTSRSAHDPR
ncbi:MAG: hypothetical protein ABI566_06485 [Pseudolysinimonas sp.]